MIKWTIVFLLFSYSLFGQDVTISPGKEKLIHVQDGFNLDYLVNDDRYVLSRWAKGKLFYANNSFKEYDSLNFNRYDNIIELIVNNKPLSLYAMGLAGALIYTSDNSGYILVSVPVEGENKLMMVYSTGKYVLAGLASVNDTNFESNVKVDEIRFVPKPEKEVNVNNDYYIWEIDKWSSFKLTKSNIAKLFQSDKKEISSIYVQLSKQSNEEESLIKLFDYLN